MSNRLKVEGWRLNSGVVHLQDAHHVSHATEWLLMGVLFLFVLAAVVFAIKKYTDYQDREVTGLAKFFANKWYIDEVYDAIVVKPILEIGDVLKKYVEKAGLVALVGGMGLFSVRASKQVRALQNGNVGFYILLLLLSILEIEKEKYTFLREHGKIFILKRNTKVILLL